MSLRLTAHWLAVTFAACTVAAALPFTGAAGSAASSLAAAAVGFIGLVLAPATRKDRT